MPASASSCSTTCRPALRRRCRSRCCRSSATSATRRWSASLIEAHEIDAIIHFAGSTIVPESVRDPLGYYRNNTANSRALIEAAVKGGVRHFIFSSTAAVYGNPARVPVAEDDPTAAAVALRLVEADDRDDAARRRRGARAPPCGAALLQRRRRRSARAHRAIDARAPRISSRSRSKPRSAAAPRIDVYGTDYPTPDGTCIRDFIHVSDLARAHRAALGYLRGRRQHDAELRLRPRLFGARGARRGPTRASAMSSR